MLQAGKSGGRARPACLALVLFLGAAAANAQSAPSKVPTAAEINSVLQELSDISGFKITRQLPFALINRDEVNRYIQEQIRSSVKPDEIRAEELTLKKFGFAPADFDLKKTTIDLLTEQAAAFYDFRRKKLFISDWATQNMRDAALIHELGHALADQNFPIRKFLGKDDDSEVSMARQAVVEGQASWLTLEVTARRSGHTMAEPDMANALLIATSDAAGAEFPVFSRAPLYLQRTLMFPYDDGQKFQQALFLHEGKDAFSRVFRQPPVSTAQIVHPDLYFKSVAPVHADLPKPMPHTKAFATGTLGEVETHILLEQYLGASFAESLAPRLKGAAYRLDEVRPRGRFTLVYSSEWSDPDAAARYFDAYSRILRGKWKQIDIVGQQEDRISGKGDDGYFRVVRTGTRVVSEEGFPSPF